MPENMHIWSAWLSRYLVLKWGGWCAIKKAERTSGDDGGQHNKIHQLRLLLFEKVFDPRRDWIFFSQIAWPKRTEFQEEPRGVTWQYVVTHGDFCLHRDHWSLRKKVKNWGFYMKILEGFLCLGKMFSCVIFCLKRLSLWKGSFTTFIQRRVARGFIDLFIIIGSRKHGPVSK